MSIDRIDFLRTEKADRVSAKSDLTPVDSRSKEARIAEIVLKARKGIAEVAEVPIDHVKLDFKIVG